MPIPVIKYRCQYKCGRQAKENKNAVEEHEATCWNNPENKTCKTCQFESYSTQYEDYGNEFPRREWKERHCLHPEGDKITEEVYELLKIDELHIKPVTHCPNWRKK